MSDSRIAMCSFVVWVQPWKQPHSGLHFEPGGFDYVVESARCIRLAGTPSAITVSVICAVPQSEAFMPVLWAQMGAQSLLCVRLQSGLQSDNVRCSLKNNSGFEFR
jgi:hypothetical protein